MKNDGTSVALGVAAALAAIGVAMRRRRGSRSQFVPKDGRWYPFFYGTRHGTWEQHERPILGFRREGLDWEMAASMSMRNEWRNWMVEGATEHDPGFIAALREIVAKYPEAIEFDIAFDGPFMRVRDLLSRMGKPKPIEQIKFLHGTSTRAWERIQRQGLRPRRQHDGPAAYGAHIQRAHQADEGAVYLTVEPNAALFASWDAARVTGSEPIVLVIKGIDSSKLEADEDTMLEPRFWKRSLESLGSIKYRGTIPPELISVWRGHER